MAVGEFEVARSWEDEGQESGSEASLREKADSSCISYNIIKIHKVQTPIVKGITLIKMGRYSSTTMCHYWDMSINSQYTAQ